MRALPRRGIFAKCRDRRRSRCAPPGVRPRTSSLQWRYDDLYSTVHVSNGHVKSRISFRNRPHQAKIPLDGAKSWNLLYRLLLLYGTVSVVETFPVILKCQAWNNTTAKRSSHYKMWTHSPYVMFSTVKVPNAIFLFPYKRLTFCVVLKWIWIGGELMAELLLNCTALSSFANDHLEAETIMFIDEQNYENWSRHLTQSKCITNQRSFRDRTV